MLIWHGNFFHQQYTRIDYLSDKALKNRSYLKNTILNAVTAVEAYCNELLIKEEGWDGNKIKSTKVKKVFEEFCIDYDSCKFKTIREIRNDFIVHYKREDQRFAIEITEQIALLSIESAQEVIAEICFKRGVIFPYWITGLNFINPLHGCDIWLAMNIIFGPPIRRSHIIH